MSKKFLTVFALVALLVAAMAGAAFAAEDGDVLEVVRSADTGVNIGPLAPSTPPTPTANGTLNYTANAYYLAGTSEDLKVAIGVSLDFQSTAVSGGKLSADVLGNYKIQLTTVDVSTLSAKSWKSLDITLSSWDVTPETITITKIGTHDASGFPGGSVEKSADLTITTVAVPVQTGTIALHPEAHSKSLDVKELFADYTLGSLTLSSDKTANITTSSDLIFVGDKAYGQAAFNAGTGVITVALSEDVPSNVTAMLYVTADGITVDDAEDAAVAGFTAANTIATITVNATADVPPPPVGPSVTLSAYEYNYVIGEEFPKSFDVTATDCEIAGANIAVIGGTPALLEQASLGYNAEKLVFTGTVTATGWVDYQIGFAVSQDGDILSTPISLDFTLRSATGYVFDNGQEDIIGAKDYPMNVVMTVTYEPAARSADLAAKKHTVRIRHWEDGSILASGDMKAEWDGVTVTFDAKNARYTFAGVPKTTGARFWADVAFEDSGIMTDLWHNILIANMVSNVTSGIQVGGENGTGMTINKANVVTFPLKSGDMGPQYATDLDPSLQISGPNFQKHLLGDLFSASDATNGTYNHSTGVIGATVTPTENGDYYFDAGYWKANRDLVMERATLSVGGGHSSSSGCDMGFGAFALLGLAGAAALLRRKD